MIGVTWSGHGLPTGLVVGPAVLELLARSDAELVAARLAEPTEGYVHAHLAALRAGAALLAVTGRPRSRGVRTVWQLVAAAAPELTGWTALFAGGAALRARAESGLVEVDPARTEATADAAERFADEVRRLIGVDGQGVLAVRAS